MFGIITIKGNASSGRKASKWLVREAVNAEAAYSCITFAMAIGAIGNKDILRDTNGNHLVKADVHRICNHCGKLAGVYSEGHEACFEPNSNYINKPHEIER